MKNLLKSFWFNVLLIIGVCAVLYFAFFSSLSQITRHDEELMVPELIGKQYAQAHKELEKLGFEIVVDSVYDTAIAPLAIVEVQPEAGSTVKKGRSIFITINKKNPPEVEMPNLLNLSFRSAKILLESNKLVLGDTTYRPDMAEGAVLEQLINGQPVTPKTKLFQGTVVDLVIGGGFSMNSIFVPNLTNLTYAQARIALDSLKLFYTEVWDGTITDSNAAYIYFQLPQPRNEQGYPNNILEGENIDIRIRQQPLEIDSNSINSN